MVTLVRDVAGHYFVQLRSEDHRGPAVTWPCPHCGGSNEFWRRVCKHCGKHPSVPR